MPTRVILKSKASLKPAPAKKKSVLGRLFGGVKWRARVKGQTPLMKIMRELDCYKSDGAMFLAMFEDIDTDHSGTIDVDEFYVYLGVPATGYGRMAFSMMRIVKDETLEKQHKELKARKKKKKVKKDFKKKESELHYAEFFVALYSFCTMDQRSFVRYTFDMIDVDESGKLTRDEIFELVRLMEPTEEQAQIKCAKLMNVLNNKEAYTVEEFEHVHNSIQSLLFPAFQLRELLKKKCLGKKWWRRALRTRKKIEAKTGMTPLQLYASVMKWQEDDGLKDEIRDLKDDLQIMGGPEESNGLDAADFDEIEQKALLALDELDASQEAERGRMQAILDNAARMKKTDVIKTRHGSWWSEDQSLAAALVVPAKPNDVALYYANEEAKLHHPKIHVDAATGAVLAAAEASRWRATLLGEKEGERRLQLETVAAKHRKAMSAFKLKNKKGVFCSSPKKKQQAAE